VFWRDLRRRDLIAVSEQYTAALRDRVAHASYDWRSGVNRLTGREDGTVDNWRSALFCAGLVSA
jgi:hypothetical protein